MFWMRLVGCLVLAVLLGGTVQAADPDRDAKSGLKVGTKAPAFTLKDQNGKERTLADLLKKGKVAIVFHRSASW